MSLWQREIDLECCWNVIELKNVKNLPAEWGFSWSEGKRGRQTKKEPISLERRLGSFMKFWQSLGDSNPCRRAENPLS